MGIIKETSKNKATLVLIPSLEYNNLTRSIAKELSGKKVAYATLNKTADSLKEAFANEGINTKGFMFVDCISKTVKDIRDTEDTHYLSSAAALTELSLMLTKMMNIGFQYILFDSITNLLTYSPKTTVIKFVHFLVNKMRESDAKAVFYILDIEEHKQVLQECSTMMDSVIDLRKK